MLLMVAVVMAQMRLRRVPVVGLLLVALLLAMRLLGWRLERRGRRRHRAGELPIRRERRSARGTQAAPAQEGRRGE